MNNDVMFTEGVMKKSLFVLLILVLTACLGFARILTVPDQFSTIQGAIDSAVAIQAGNPAESFIIIVRPGVYGVPDNPGGDPNDPSDGIDFQGLRNVTLTSQTNPDNPNWDIVDSTIIDCGGGRRPYQNMSIRDPEDEDNIISDIPRTYLFSSRRAFNFHNGEDSTVKVIGFTIRNGYIAGDVGGHRYWDNGEADLYFPNKGRIINLLEENVENILYRAPDGVGADGNGYGGAVLCDGASPQIIACVFRDNAVSGGQGGYGWRGLDAGIGSNLPGEWGGHGGPGHGFGFGGAIACINTSNPAIQNCHFINNKALGGVGGIGGHGGVGDGGQQEGSGGNGGDSGYLEDPAWVMGDPGAGLVDPNGAPQHGTIAGTDNAGLGGAIYIQQGSEPVLDDCYFLNNLARSGMRGFGGQRAVGQDRGTEPFLTVNGGDGFVLFTTDMTGGAICVDQDAASPVSSTLTLNNCRFEVNMAAIVDDQFLDPSPDVATLLQTPDLVSYSTGGAMRIRDNHNVYLNNCDFLENEAGAVYVDFSTILELTNCDFINNHLKTGWFESLLNNRDGAAIFMGFGSPSFLVKQCQFISNTAVGDGAAIYTLSDLIVGDSTFARNVSETGIGGAIYTFGLDIQLKNTSFTENRAVWGGALFVDELQDVTILRNQFWGNRAESGGAIYLSDTPLGGAAGTVAISDSIFRENIATDGTSQNIGGGAIAAVTSDLHLDNCQFKDNQALGDDGYGGALNLYGGHLDTLPFDHDIFNCLFDGNHAQESGGAAAVLFWSDPEFTNCTFVNNTADGVGSAVFKDWTQSGNPTAVIDSILAFNEDIALYEEDFGGSIDVTWSMFHNNTDGDIYKADTGVFPASTVDATNRNVNPKFAVHGSLGEFFLETDSPAVDGGSVPSTFAADYTTQVNGDADIGTVDLGYHYLVPDPAERLTLNIQAGPNGGFKVGESDVVYNQANPYPATLFYPGQMIKITAVPNAGYRVDSWSGGTMDDSTMKKINYVLINANKTIQIVFGQPDFLHVGSDAEYSSVEEAVYNAKEGDVVVVHSGTWHQFTTILLNKNIRITSENPDSPGSTILAGNSGVPGADWHHAIFYIGPDTDETLVIEGFTLTGCNWVTASGADGAEPGERGVNGTHATGGAMQIAGGASPIIRNCIIRDNSIRSGSGGNGADSDEYHNAGRGGWSGFARGGAVYIESNAKPRFENVAFEDNTATAGNGGNGGNKAHANTTGNYGGNWSLPYWLKIEPFDEFVIEDDLWRAWGYIGDYRYYSAYGGAVYCDQNSEPVFVDCSFSGNRTFGGHSGQGGTLSPGRREPIFPFVMPSFGGAIYCAANTKVDFDNCSFENNTAAVPGSDSPPAADEFWADPAYMDFFTGHGGAVCAEGSAMVTFTNRCKFSGNQAAVGGALQLGGKSDAILVNAEFIENEAFNGAGLHAVNAYCSATSTTFTSNRATLQPGMPITGNEDSTVYGLGGAVCSLTTISDFYDCVFTDNRAMASGGAMFVRGSDADELIDPVLFNCLLDNNFSGSDGGAITATLYALLTLENCTVADNGAYWNTSKGGGLAALRNANIDILNSIIWGNKAYNGSQLAIDAGDEYEPLPSTMSLSYTDLQILPSDEDTLQPNLTVSPVGDPFTLVDTILGEGITLVDVPTYIGADVASGTFRGGIAAGLGIESGIILTTGEAALALPPNEFDGATAINGLEGDEDLDALLDGFTTNDATVLEFQFRSRGGDLFFNFVFASEEYNEFTNDVYNDVFAFFLDGTNIALIPGTTLPVTINNVNGGNPFGLNATNPDLFKNNDLDDGGPFYNIEYDGFTQVFTAQALGLSPGTHTIKLAIADASDESLDSAIFIQAESFSDAPTIPFGDPIFLDDYSSIEGWTWSSVLSTWVPGSNNLAADPCFIQGNLGAYYLSQEYVSPDQGQSPAVDAGNRDSDFGPEYTTRTDNFPDNSIIDLGFHYPTMGFQLAEPCRRCDLVLDGRITLEDMAIVASKWLDPDNKPCSAENNWCDGADFVSDVYRVVDFRDLLYFIDCWLAKDTTAPSPDPTTWAPNGQPASNSPTSILMSAVPTTDNWDYEVEYEFECVSGPGCPRSSGWVLNRQYEDLGLLNEQMYTYRVRARDNAGNVTQWSSELGAIAGEDTTPPEPFKALWSVQPYSIDQTSVGMEAVVATDAEGNGVEYYFTCVSGPCNDSGWQASPIYEDTGLTSGQTVAYTVTYRDKSINLNEGEASDWATVIVGGPVDTTPPTPDPMTFSVAPFSNDCGSITMSATTATDTSLPIQYLFENVTTGATSGWITSANWSQTNLTNLVSYDYRVKARDAKGNETEWSDVQAAVAGEGVDCLAPYPSNGVQGDPAEWAFGGTPIRLFGANPDGYGYYDAMTAQEATDESDVVYIFECRGDCSVSLAIELDPTYQVGIPSKNFITEYRVKYRDVSPRQNESGWSEWVESFIF